MRDLHTAVKKDPCTNKFSVEDFFRGRGSWGFNFGVMATAAHRASWERDTVTRGNRVVTRVTVHLI